MTNESEPKTSSDVNVEIKKIESTERLQEGWQKIINNVVDAFERSWKHGKQVERYNFRIILIVAVILFVGVGLLTWQKIVQGETFALLAGTIIGYLLSISPLGRPPAK